MLRKIFTSTALALTVLLVASCSGSDYINAIPSGSTAIMRLDIGSMGESEGSADASKLLARLLHVSDASDCGLSASDPIYLFISPDGNLGLSAAVSSHSDVDKWFGQMASSGLCQKPVERHDISFTVLKGTWVVGYTSHTLLVMGPATAAAQPELLRQMARQLEQDEDDGAKNSPLFTKLETLDSPMAMVSQAAALPETFVAPFVLGAPKGSDASQVLIAAKMSVGRDHILRVDGQTYSDNPTVDKGLKSACSQYRPITGRYLQSMPRDAMMGLFMNVDGRRFLPLMLQDKTLLQLMAGVNAAIDMNKIVSSVGGDMAVIVPRYSDSSLQLMWGADLASTGFLADVPYWKKSVPAGGRITDEGKNFFAYQDKQTTFFFGVSPSRQFYSGSSRELSQSLLSPVPQQLPAAVSQLVKGKRVGLVVSLGGINDKNNIMQTLKSLLEPLFGRVDYMVYTM